MKPRQLMFAFIFTLVAVPAQLALAQTAALATGIDALKPLTIAPREFNPRGYYTIRQDFRKCVSPLCGGYFVKRVNRKLTRCADGSRQPECYVASINWRRLGLNPLAAVRPASFDEPLPLLLRGRIRPQEFKGFGNLGKFVVKSAHRAVGQFNASSLYVGLQDNGIVCITTPCFSTDQYVLNSKRLRAVSGVDLGGVKASDEDLKHAAMILVDGGVLLAAGKNETTSERFGNGLNFVANQFFLPLRKPVR